MINKNKHACLEINKEFAIQVERNKKAIELQKKGEVNKAIELYEMIIADNFEGNYPYDSLAIIYRNREQFDDEIRVLEKAIWVFENVVNEKRMDRAPKLNKFKVRLEQAKRLDNGSKL